MKDETKSRILDAGKELFFRHGIKRVTMDDLSRHLGMSKKTLYQAYFDKDTLVVELTEQLFKDYMLHFEENMRSAKDAIDELLLNMKFLGTIFSQMSPNFYYDMQKYYRPSWLKFKEFKDRDVISLLELNLKRGIAEDLYRQDLDITIMSRLRVEEVELAMNPGVFPPDKFNVLDVQMRLLDHFMHGISTLKGHKLINDYKQVNEE